MSATMESTCKACGGSGVVGFDRTCSACEGIGATPDQRQAFREQAAAEQPATITRNGITPYRCKPWRVGGIGDGGTRLVIDADCFGVCEVFRNSAEQRDADARLIAAAPALLAACRVSSRLSADLVAVLDQIDAGPEWDRLADRAQDLRDVINAVLAKVDQVIGATPDQIAAWRAQYRACEQCGHGFLPAADELQCERCRCQTCGDLPYSYVEGDREIGDCCPECGRGDEEP